MLWLKKKFVVETNYCVTLDRVPEELYPQIIENKAQLDEWKKSAEPLHQKWADAVRAAGGDPVTIMKEFKASLAQYNAAY